MPPKNPVERHRPVPTRSKTEIGKVRSISAVCGRKAISLMSRPPRSSDPESGLRMPASPRNSVD
jgi:hypothetical protein